MRMVFGALRLIAAGAIIAAIVGQFVNSWNLVPDRAFFFVNFFSFFTILSNALAAIVLLVGAYYAVTRSSDPGWYNIVRACAVTYMATTFVVYNLLLRDIPLPQGTTVPWSNEILHVWAPLYLIVDWVLAPGRHRILLRRLWVVAVFPIVWVIYTLIRGAGTGWYPYPFLNPAQEAGYRGVGFYVIMIAAFILFVGAGVMLLSRTKWPHDDDAEAVGGLASTDSASGRPLREPVEGSEADARPRAPQRHEADAAPPPAPDRERDATSARLDAPS